MRLIEKLQLSEKSYTFLEVFLALLLYFKINIALLSTQVEISPNTQGNIKAEIQYKRNTIQADIVFSLL